MVSALQLKRQLLSEFVAVSDETRASLQSGSLTHDGATLRLEVLEGIYTKYSVVSQKIEASYEYWGYVDPLVKVRLEKTRLTNDFEKIQNLLRWFIHGPAVSFTGETEPVNAVDNVTVSQKEDKSDNMATGGSTSAKEALEKQLEELDEEKRKINETLRRLELEDQEKKEAEERARMEEQLYQEEMLAQNRLEMLRRATEEEEAKLQQLREQSASLRSKSGVVDPAPYHSGRSRFDPLVSSTPFSKGASHTPVISEEAKPSYERTKMPAMYDLLTYDKLDPLETTTPGINDPSRYLSKIPVLKFNGDKKSFPGWWSAFEECVDKSPLPPAIKLLRLYDSLEDEALEVVKGLGYSPEAYDVAKTALQRHFGGIRRQLTLISDELYSFPQIKDNNARDLEKFSHLLDRLVVNLKSTQNVGELGTGYLYNGLLKKMTPMLITKYKRWMVDGQNEENVENLRFFINQESEFLTLATESVYGVCSTSQKSEKKPKQKTQQGRTLAVESQSIKNVSSGTSLDSGTSQRSTYAQSTKKTCRLCSKEHGLWECDQYMKLKPDGRWKKLKELNLCLKCLGPHNYKRCWRKRKCGVDGCTLPHHDSLHDPARATAATMFNQQADVNPPQKPEDDTANQAENKTDSSTEKARTCHTPGLIRSHVAFRTVPVYLKNDGRIIRVNALLDDASNRSYISEKAADYLHLEGEESDLTVKAVGKAVHKVRSRLVSCILESDNGSLRKNFTAQSLPSISEGLQVHDLTKKKQLWDHLKGINFPTPAGPHIDVLIGLDYLELMASRGEDIIGESGPCARLTPLGWTFVGNCSSESMQEEDTRTYHIQLDDSLNKAVKQFWELEEVSIEPVYTKEEQKAMNIAQSTLYRDETGRYGVGVPWRERPKPNPKNYDMAFKRLKSVEKKLLKDPKLAEAYQAVIDEYLLKGYIKKITLDELKNYDIDTSWLLPHFPVVRTGAQTTKVRPVFDASAEVDGYSLNFYIIPGPKLQKCLLDVLLRFRRNAIAVQCDVKQMYMQIMLLLEDKPFHRFLWRSLNQDQDPEIYEFQRVVFGANASPFLAQFVAQRHAEKYLEEYPEAADMILKGTYMDDGHGSVHTAEEGKKLVNDVKMIWNDACMEVHKWFSNSTEVLESLPVEERITKLDLSTHELPKSKALGCGIDGETDELYFSSEAAKKPIPQTKREFLCILATVFDPLGIVSPVLVRGKTLLQRCWASGCDWDEVLPDALRYDIRSWINDLIRLQEVRIPRMLIPSADHDIYLHGFSDSSEESYGAVVYTVCVKPDEDPWVNLVASKSKVAPLTKTSISRLELEAAVLLAKLIYKVSKALDIPENRCYCWVDSSNVLHWVCGFSREHKTYVASRIATIQPLMPPERWKYVPGKLNPADIVSRGSTVTDLLDNMLWYQGPDFIQQPMDQWPKFEVPIPDPRSLEKKKTSVFTFYTTSATMNAMNLKDTRLEPKRWSDLPRLLKTIATVDRSVRRFKGEVIPPGPITVEEYNEAHNLVIRYAQSQHFSPEIKFLNGDRKTCLDSSIKDLNPWLDEEGILRSKTRLVQGESIPWEIRYPIILPKSDPLTDLIVLQLHKEVGHAGPGTVLSQVLKKYWIPCARDVIREAMKKCMICRRDRARTLQPIMAPLPSDRLDGFDFPFTIVSVDFAGPFFTIAGRGRSRNKRYMCLYTCMHTRAVHLELVMSLSTQDFLLALVRITARRGKPKIVYSDNGSNFLGAVTELDQFDAILKPDDLIKATAEMGIDWKFQPPLAPHFSGVHEALVKSAKIAVYKQLKNADITDDELRTMFCDAERILNDRPLTYQSLDPKDDLVLTPSHFNLGRRAAPLVDPTKEDHSKQLRLRWRFCTNLVTEVWERWMLEWVTSLGRRKKWKKNCDQLTEGDIVLVADPQVPKGQWNLGRISRTFPGKDGVVRVVEVRTGGMIMKRPVVRICLLEKVKA